MKESIALLKQLVAIKSIAGNPGGLDEVLRVALRELTGFTIERFIQNGVPSALVYVGKTRPKKFKILLNAHLDVVPTVEAQFTPRVKGKRLYGAGSMDMKAGAACLIAAFADVAREVAYPLALQLTTDEEIGGFDGTKFQINKGVRADFVIAGEPTNFDIVNKAKGVVWLEITVPGVTAHGAYPWRGENAIWKMYAFLEKLRTRYPIPTKEAWVTTINLSGIAASNQVLNKIPDDCTVKLDIRVVPEDAATVIPTIKKMLPKGSTMNVIEDEAALYTAQSNEYFKTLQQVARKVLGKKIVTRGANGTSDARHFMRVGGVGVEFGPIGGDIGSDCEWVDLPSLATYYKIMTAFLRTV